MLKLCVLLAAFAGLVRSAATFDVALIKPSGEQTGPDYNNRLTIGSGVISGQNVTLRRLLAEAFKLQLQQVEGAAWLDAAEYDIELRTGPVGRSELDGMLRSLLAERFALRQHRETRTMRVYELRVSAEGFKLSPVEGSTDAAPKGLRFRGDMHRFADFLAVQFSIPATVDPAQPAVGGGPMIPVIDRTGLNGVYELNADVPAETGTDSFTLWQRVLTERLGLRIESRRAPVDVLVVDHAERTPAPN